MLPTIGIVVSFYVITRMVEMWQTKQSGMLGFLSFVTITVSIFAIIRMLLS